MGSNIDGLAGFTKRNRRSCEIFYARREKTLGPRFQLKPQPQSQYLIVKLPEEVYVSWTKRVGEYTSFTATVRRVLLTSLVLKIGEMSPLALTLTEPVPEAFESPASDWPEKNFSGQSMKRSIWVSLLFSYTTYCSSSIAVVAQCIQPRRFLTEIFRTKC